LGAGEEVVVALVVPGCDRAELFDFVEEALNVGAAIQEGAEGRMPLAVRHRSYVGPDSARREFDPKRVGIMGAIGEQYFALADVTERIGCAASVVRLAVGELEPDRQGHPQYTWRSTSAG